ncbi:diguanylate cyclase domain-containing protein [Actinoplanes sp. HUAS TT8]|uniref:diguanylate cyclase domain-containing protein n=1 Tax=Actinoplanes sp. HUAS TT8 TaxID=3447453 RepID=UPI003F528AE2
MLLVLLVGLVMSFVAYEAVDSGEDRYAGQLMDRYAEEVTDAITDRVTTYGDTLSDLSYAVGAQTDLSQDDFNRITAGLDANRLPGAAAVGFIVPASTAQVTAVQRYWRGQGSPGLVLRLQSGTGIHHFLIFEKAFDDRSDMRGTDVAASAPVASVLQTAQRNGVLQVSPAYQMLRDSTVVAAQGQPSVMLAIAVYSGLGSSAPDEFKGWVVMGVRGQDFLSQTLLDRGQGTIGVTVADTVSGSEVVLAAVTPGRGAGDSALVRQRSVTVAQRQWQVTITPTTRILTAAARGMSRLALAAGAALSLLLAALTGVLVGSRNRALDQVERATVALREDIVRRESIETSLRERESQLQHQAFHDPLTGLANRILFYDRLAHAMDTQARTGQAVAVLFIDLDGFKAINDRHGHQAGDTVLREIAGRLRVCLRHGDTLARFGGDEFAVILEGLTAAADACTAAHRVIEIVQEPIDLPEAVVGVSASVGIAVNRAGVSADELLKEADDAMYAAKAAGKNRYIEAG